MFGQMKTTRAGFGSVLLLSRRTVNHLVSLHRPASAFSIVSKNILFVYRKPQVRPTEPARPGAFYQGSLMVVFWCKCGVNRRDRFRKTLTYQAFLPSGSYPAVINEQTVKFSSCPKNGFLVPLSKLTPSLT